MSIEKLNELKDKQDKYQLEVNDSQEGLKDLYNYIPFGLAGNEMSDLMTQLKEEKSYRQNKLQLEGVEDKTTDLLNDLDISRKEFNGFIDLRIRDFYESEIKKLILKHFYNNFDTNKYINFQPLHDFTDIQFDDFQTLINNIKESKSRFEKLSDSYFKAKAELNSIERKIKEAEKNAESDYIQNLRKKKENKEDEMSNIYKDITRLNVRKDDTKEQIKANRQKKEILSKKIDVSAQNKAVDDEASKLISTIQKFLIRFKDEKKKALENKLQSKLNAFLHKKDLVNKVIVDIQGNGEDVDINLYDYNNRKIDKGILSMGERQMFASALLGALVEETELEFPVFIDSPMQKFDTNHSRNILTKFYPNVSKQVILFPLLMKELTEEEYSLIESNVNKAYLIENSKDGSHFKEVTPCTLFDQYKNI